MLVLTSAVAVFAAVDVSGIEAPVSCSLLTVAELFQDAVLDHVERLLVGSSRFWGLRLLFFRFSQRRRGCAASTVANLIEHDLAPDDWLLEHGPA